MKNDDPLARVGSVGFTDIIFIDKWQRKHVWEVKALSVGWSAQPEAQWYVDRLNDGLKPGEMKVALLGWNINKELGPNGHGDMVSGIGAGAIVYYKPGQKMSPRIAKQKEEDYSCMCIPTHDLVPGDPGYEETHQDSGGNWFDDVKGFGKEVLGGVRDDLNKWPMIPLPVPVPVPVPVP